MSTYNDNLRVTVSKTLSEIDAEQEKRASTLKVAQYDLYYAVGDQIRAEHKFDKVNDSYKQTWDIDHQGVSCSNRANNLLTTATHADENVTATVTNTATAATNVQVAANAILKVAAGIGSANNIVRASDYDTDIQHMATYANEVMSETAYQAEQTSQTAMQASTKASQIIAKQVLDEATATKTEFDDMLAATQARLSKLTEIRIADTNALIAANTAQRGKEGELNVAEKKHGSVTNSYSTSNKTLNYDLKVNTDNAYPGKDENKLQRSPDQVANSKSATSLTTVNVCFEAFVPPFEIKNVEGNPIKLKNHYYMAVAKAATAGMLTFEVAETTFNSFSGDRFVQVYPGGPTNKPNVVVLRDNGWEKTDVKTEVKTEVKTDVKTDVKTEEKTDVKTEVKTEVKTDVKTEVKTEVKTDVKTEVKTEEKELMLKKDINGKLIKAGTPYVVFLYIVYDLAYKKATNNFSDQLAAPSLPFTLATTLADVKYACDKTCFSVTPAVGNPKTEYRFIMVLNHSLCHSDNKNCKSLEPVKHWFDLNIAEQVAQVNYQKVEKTEDKILYTIKQDNTTTDNFGQLTSNNSANNVDAMKEDKYIPVVLSVVSSDATDAQGQRVANQYLSKLTWLCQATPHSKGVAKNTDTAPPEENC